MAEPPTIAAIRPTKRDPSRSTVRVGRRVVVTLYQQHIDELGLHVGQAWTEELAAELETVSSYDQALRKAMQRVARRAMSRAEIDRKLREQGFDEPVRQRVLDRLTELNYLDDRAFGRMLIHDLLMRRPAGPRLLRQKLMQKGLSQTLVSELVSEAVEQDDQLEGAEALLRKKLPSVRGLDAMKRKRRLIGLLQRRGFDLDVIQKAMQRVGDEVEPT